jgi:hypothetical protein
MIEDKKLSEIDINLISKNIVYEINKLPKIITDNIIINKKIDKINIDNKFFKYVKSEKLEKIDFFIRNNYISNELYDNSVECIKDGFICRKISIGRTIYKTFTGFLLEDDIINYSNNNLDKPSWFGNKYICYTYAKIAFGSIIAFKIIKEIYLIDFFNIKNIKKIIEIIKVINPIDFENYNVSKNKFLKHIQIITGYNISLSEHIKSLYYESKWNEIYIYTNDYYNKDSYYEKNIIKIKGLNPISNLKNIYTYDIVLFKLILNNYDIDGIIRRVIKSKFDDNGNYKYEEMVLKNSSILEKIKYDKKNQMTWTNWKIDKFKNYEGLDLRYSLLKNTNNNFSLHKFYLKNNLKYIKLNSNNKYILSYNVHSFVNLNKKITIFDNINNICNMILYYKNNISIICLQEAYFENEKVFNFFYDKLKKYYPYINYCQNGSLNFNKEFKKYKNGLICLLSKHKQQAYIQCDKQDLSNTNNKEIIDLSLNINELKKIKNDLKKIDEYYNHNIFKTHRECIITSIENKKIAFIHLEIGIRNVFPINKKKEINIIINKIINKINSYIRICMLKKIISYEPDIIIGDFNFQLKDDETLFLQKYNYNHQKINSKKSSPYNRIDHCFVKNEILKKNILLKCNYSDHLPML